MKIVSYISISFAACLLFSFTADEKASDLQRITRLTKERAHESVAKSIGRYIYKYGSDRTIEQKQIVWYKSLKTDVLDSSIFKTRKVKYIKKPKGCYGGKLDTSEYLSFESNLNFVRLVASLPKVNDIDMESSRNCQEAAWCLDANNTITHSIPKSYKCYSIGAAVAAAKANLSYGYGAGRAILGMLRDEEKSNISVGHRRWLLNPSLTFPGYGLTDKIMVVQVIGSKTNFRNVSHDLTEYEKRGIAWPVAGVHPLFLATKRFSYSLAKANFKAARVSVRKNNKAVIVRKQPVKPNFGNPTIVFDVQENPKSGDRYDIIISNITANGGVKKNVRYSVLVKAI